MTTTTKTSPFRRITIVWIPNCQLREKMSSSKITTDREGNTFLEEPSRTKLTTLGHLKVGRHFRGTPRTHWRHVLLNRGQGCREGLSHTMVVIVTATRLRGASTADVTEPKAYVQGNHQSYCHQEVTENTNCQHRYLVPRHILP
ncbi:uncharacterized protein LOC110440348 [Mizuhopecten yessoensis]|uniref:Uncharacterized protein n=1 Tax=Mizuhopecten yessoensis TaxID=6573 RepID=A0A210PLE3_MIZYE|nr:uncharacterized protein LOC110440348 [Mizuhopecten yessoensis]OWF37312.1 hypothetical protein KP79_PYT12665 [Mizuhopecten yessoensis]